MNWLAWWVAAAALMQAALVLGLLAYLGWIRVPMVLRGEIKLRAVALSREPWPEREKKVSNAVDNQFQLPVLFFVGALLLLHLGLVGWVDVLLAWLFIALRITHAIIHVTTNRVPRRFIAFSAGLAVLAVFWLWLTLRILIAPSI